MSRIARWAPLVRPAKAGDQAGPIHRGIALSPIPQQCGIATVEMAIVVSVLFLVLFSIMEVGFMMYDKAIVTNASREAARAATKVTWTACTSALNSALTTAATSAMQGVCGNSGQNLLNFKIGGSEVCRLSLPDPTGDTTNCKISVTVTYDFYTTGFTQFIPEFPNPKPLASTTVMYMQ